MTKLVSSPGRSEFLDLLHNYLDEDEIIEICFRSRIVNYEDLAGSNKKARCMDLISKAERRGKYEQLWSAFEQLRPNLASESDFPAVQSGINLSKKLSLEAQEFRRLGKDYRIYQEMIADDKYLARVDLSNAILFELDLEDYELREAFLDEAVLTKAILNSANLQSASLKGITLDKASLIDATLIEADLTKGSLFRANLTAARAERAILKDAQLREARLINTDLTGADLARCDLRGANLENATLVECKLNGANLRNAILKGADLSGAELDKADLQGANLQGAKVTGGQLHTVKNLLNATLPDGQLASEQQPDVYILNFDLDDRFKTDLQLIEQLRHIYNEHKICSPKVYGDDIIEKLAPIQLVNNAFELLDENLSSLVWQTSLFIFCPDHSSLSHIINPLALKKIFERTGYWPQVIGLDGILYNL